MKRTTVWACVVSVVHATLVASYAAEPAPDVLPGTAPLVWEGDVASRMVDEVDAFLLRQIENAAARRDERWSRDTTSPERYARSVEGNRRRLAALLGLRDERPERVAMELVATTSRPAEVAAGPGYRVLRVRWNAFGDVHGEGLLLEPDATPVAAVIAIPDAEQSPEAVAGLAPGCESVFAARLAAAGCRVVVPAIVSRSVQSRRNAELTNREFLHRSAFELGRTLTGYELQKFFAAVDWIKDENEGLPIGVAGWGEGGRLALYAAALDERIDSAAVSGYFGPRLGLWNEPLDRNVFGLLSEFGDAEVASLIAPRSFVVEEAPGSEAEVRTRGGAPYRLASPSRDEVAAEFGQAVQPTRGLPWRPLYIPPQPGAAALNAQTLVAFLETMAPGDDLLATTFQEPQILGDFADEVAAREERAIHEIDRHNQTVLETCAEVRKEFFQDLDASSLETYAASIEQYREIFRTEVVGDFELPLAEFNARTRKAYDEPTWTGYEVVLDVHDSVFAYGVLLVPKGLAPGEQRPVVVCQHGLEGRPQNVIAGDHGAYHDYAARLAEQGYITFAPQNLYIFEDRFRTLQRKANTIGKTLFSVIVPQHRQITNWLATLPEVDPERIAFYGLSYGGKSAMRIPPLVDRYCLSICSADFNDWVWKNASTNSPYSYVWTMEYEIFEWNLGNTFNYAEMAALIAPRPFMVERGHFDGVAPDERVAYEFAKVRNLYQARLGLGDRCEIEFFVGPHTIHGVGTFEFLAKHLARPPGADSQPSTSR